MQRHRRRILAAIAAIATVGALAGAARRPTLFAALEVATGRRHSCTGPKTRTPSWPRPKR